MHNISSTKQLELPVYNNGTNEMNIKFAKESLLMDAIRKQLDMVKTTKHYPHDNVMKIDLSLDAVLMSRKEYDELIKKCNE